MKLLLTSFLIAGITQACAPAPNQQNQSALQSQVDSLRLLVHEMKPGLGELMTDIQLHHSKLWFAGMDKNWKLADFELGEINETVAQAKQIETDRPETKYLTMLDMPLKSLADAIKNEDAEKFKTGYALLTHTCNSCHTLNRFEFNVIKTPDTPPVTDQEFTIEKNQKSPN